MPICLPDQVKDWLPAVEGEETRIARLINAIDAAAARYCGHPRTDALGFTMAPAAYTLDLDGPTRDESRLLVLPIRPVISVTSVKEDSAGVRTWATTVDAADYSLDAAAGELWRTVGAWVCGLRYTRVTVSAGWATPPPDLLEAIGIGVRSMWDLRKRIGVGTDASGGLVVFQNGDPLPAEAKSLLAPYRLGVVLGG